MIRSFKKKGNRKILARSKGKRGTEGALMFGMNDVISNPLPGLKYDGVLYGGWYQFTELDETAASFKASFYTKTTDREEVARVRESKRIQFEMPLV